MSSTDKLVRDARAKAAAELAAQEAAQAAAHQAQIDQDWADPAQMPILQNSTGRRPVTAAESMQVQRVHDDADDDEPGEDDDDDENPPAYGTIDRGYGRVLGTGEAVGPPPRRVRMVHAQDLEEHDDDDF